MLPGRNFFLQVQVSAGFSAAATAAASPADIRDTGPDPPRGPGAGADNATSMVWMLGPLVSSLASPDLPLTSDFIMGNMARQHSEGELGTLSAGEVLEPSASPRPLKDDTTRLTCTASEISEGTRDCHAGLTNFAWALMATVAAFSLFLFTGPCLVLYARHDATLASACCGVAGPSYSRRGCSLCPNSVR